MGDDIAGTTFTRAQRTRYREKVRRCLDVFEQMLSGDRFDTTAGVTGLEVELNLVSSAFALAMANAEVLDRIADPAFQTELGRYNIELNAPPTTLAGDSLASLENSLRESLNRAESLRHGRRFAHCDDRHPAHAHARAPHRRLDEREPRHEALEDAVLGARWEDIDLDISGPEPLRMTVDSIAPESACTSVQLHLQVAPQDFAAHWNAAQLLAGPQLALGANSPFLFGHRLWAETRTELFMQATDTRSPELRNQGARPTVWFGDRWITSIFDLFEENVRYFPALLPQLSDEEPEQVLAAGGVPRLQGLRLHNGTVWRWNRPVYDTVGGVPHCRVENRVLPAGPTVVDTIANAAFYYGCLVAMARDDRPIWSRMSFATAQANFDAGARHGVDSSFYWPGYGEVAGTSSSCVSCSRWRGRVWPASGWPTTSPPDIWRSSRRAVSCAVTGRGGRPRPSRGSRPPGSPAPPLSPR